MNVGLSGNYRKMTSYSDFTLNSPKRNWDLFRKLLFQSGVV